MKAILRVLLVALVVMVGVSACGPTPEELYQQGVGYYYNKEYSKAIECFTKASKKGHADAERYLAMIVEGKTDKANEAPQIETIEIVEENVADTVKVSDTVFVEKTVVVEKPVVVEKKPAVKENKPAVKEEKPAVKEEKPAANNNQTASNAFSVSASSKVYFAKGNLQYNPSTKKWRFADSQWDVIGDDNKNVSDSYNGWIDLFGWGTGNNPTKNSTNNKDYVSFSDWGKNSISNGGGYSWRTLTKDEWDYVFETRSTPSGVRYAKATVNGVKGVILLPDNWNISYYGLNSTNKSGANFGDNVISKDDWNSRFEPKGAIFLPLGGIRKGNGVTGVNDNGYYWTSNNFDSSGAYAVYIYDRSINAGHHYYHKNGFSVRLAR